MKNLSSKAITVLSQYGVYCAPVLFSLLAALLLALPQFFHWHFSYVQSIDEADSTLAQILYFVGYVQRNGFSFWWPCSVSGTDFFGSSLMIKTNLALFSLFPPWVAYLAFRILAYFIAIFSSYLLMRRFFSTNPLFAFLTGVFFIGRFLNSALFGHGFSMSLVPLVMLYFSRIEKLSVRSVLVSGLCGIVFGLTGHFTQTVFMIYYVFLFCLVFRTRYIHYWVLHMAAFTLGHIIIQLPDILAVVTTAPISHRAVDLWSAHSRIDPIIANFWPLLKALCSRVAGLVLSAGMFDPLYVTNLLVDYHVLIVLITSFFVVRRDLSSVFRLLAFFAITLLADAYTISCMAKIATLVFGEQSVLSRLLAKGIDTRVWMVKPLTLAMIFMFCADRIIKSVGIIHNVRNVKDVLCLGRLYFQEKTARYTGFPLRVLGGSVIVLLLLLMIGCQILSDRHVIRSQTDVAREFQNFTNYYEHPMLRELAAKRPDFQNYRVVTMQNCLRYNVSGYNTQYGFQTADGYNSSFPRRYLDFWRLIMFGTTENVGKGRVFPSQAYLFSELTPSNMNLLSLANVEYFISAQPLERKDLVPVPSAERDRMNTAFLYPFHIYRNERALPRIFAPASIDLFTDQSALIEAMKTRDAQEFRDKAIVASPDLNGMDLKAGRQGNISVSGFTFRGDRVTFHTDSPKGGLVVVLNSYSPFWKIVKGGVTDRVLPVYHTFQGILVKPGRQEVVVRYMPPYWRR